MFREFVGDYKVNSYINRADYRSFMKAIRKDKNSIEIRLLELMKQFDEQRERENV